MWGRLLLSLLMSLFPRQSHLYQIAAIWFCLSEKLKMRPIGSFFMFMVFAD